MVLGKMPPEKPAMKNVQSAFLLFCLGMTCLIAAAQPPSGNASIVDDSGRGTPEILTPPTSVRLEDRDARNEFEERRYEVVVVPVAYHVRVGVARKEDRVVINADAWYHKLRTSL
jgi:hypothetical protein